MKSKKIEKRLKAKFDDQTMRESDKLSIQSVRNLWFCRNFLSNFKNCEISETLLLILRQKVMIIDDAFLLAS